MGLNPFSLRPNELLRLFCEQPLWNYSGYCRACKSIQVSGNVCYHCNGKLRLYDEKFWRMVSNRIKAACRKDKALISKVKADFEAIRRPNQPDPDFIGPLSWLKEIWERAKKPRGRPFEARRHFQTTNKYDLEKQCGEKPGLSGATNKDREEFREMAWIEQYRENPEMRLSGKKLRM